MRIEEIKKDAFSGILKKSDDEGLKRLRFRFLSVFDKHFRDNSKDSVEVIHAGDSAVLKRDDLLDKYRMLVQTFKKNGLIVKTQPIDRALFKRAMTGVDVPSFKDLILQDNFVSIVGKFVDNPKDAETVDVLIKSAKMDDEFESSMQKLVLEILKKKANLSYGEDPFDGIYIPIYSLALVAHVETKKVDGAKELELLKAKTQIKKPEETENTIRIPIGNDCEVTATITIDADEGIKALYCGRDKKIRTYIFDKKKGWTMDKAKAWVKEHKKKEADFIKNIKKSDKKSDELYFEIVKADKKKQIIGGIIYEPHEVDTQGDYTDAEEIQKAMYKFMAEKYFKDPNRIKINHKGRKHSFPILESFQPEEDTVKGEKVVKKGSWWLMIKVTSKTIWKDIEAGELSGFSMGGSATA